MKLRPVLAIVTGVAAASSPVRAAAPALLVRVADPAARAPAFPRPVPAPAQGTRAQSTAAERVLAANRSALQEPSTSGFINAVQIYPFSDGALYHLYAAPGAVSDVALQSGETLVAVASGDTARWVIGDTSSGTGADKRTHVLVKPFAAGLSTNLVITTDRRTYHLNLTSTVKTAMAAISWSYPPDQLLALRPSADRIEPAAATVKAMEVEQLRFDYVITGDRPGWRPLRAFDDGRQTFIEFPPSLEVGQAPPLFVIGAAGEAELVNYRVHGRYYVVDRLFDVAELRLGTKRHEVVRISRADRSSAPRKGAQS